LSVISAPRFLRFSKNWQEFRAKLNRTGLVLPITNTRNFARIAIKTARINLNLLVIAKLIVFADKKVPVRLQCNVVKTRKKGHD
jgi:hypothetical protein